MKYCAKLKVILKESIKDVQGHTLYTVLKRNNMPVQDSLKVGKYFEFEVIADNAIKAKEYVEIIANEYLSNPVLETFEILELTEKS